MQIAELHKMLLEHLLKYGAPPDLVEIGHHFNEPDLARVSQSLIALEEYHGVVLHPNKQRVWIIHPFSTAPTNFTVVSAGKTYWGNCAWCSLGVAALLQPNDVVITTTLGAESEQIKIEVVGGKVNLPDYLVDFPIPMARAWDNVIYTCSVMVVFQSEAQIKSWCDRHNIEKGDVQPLWKIWEFAKEWYGNHLSRDWKKWTNEEAAQIFQRHDLKGPIWDLPLTASRF